MLNIQLNNLERLNIFPDKYVLMIHELTVADKF